MEPTSEVALMVSAICGGIATIIYSFKQVKKSDCCGAHCEQRVPDTPHVLEMGNITKKTTEV